MTTALTVKVPGRSAQNIARSEGASGPVTDMSQTTWQTTLADTSFTAGDVVLTLWQGGQIVMQIGMTTADAATLGSALGGSGGAASATSGP